MARGRMLDRRFMESKKLQQVTRDARLAYASILPFLDREGRIIAEPIYLKALVFRHSDFTLDEIAATVKTLASAGLVHLYANEDNAAIIQYEDFSRFNSPNQKEAKSDLPGPDDSGAMPCRDPDITSARAMHEQPACNAGGERNVNGTSTLTTAEGREPETDDATSAEARTHALLTTGRSETTDAPLARAFFSRLIGTDNARHPQCRDNLTRWYQDFTEPEIRALWDAARQNPENKPRLYYFVDALNGLKPTTGTNRQHDGPTPEQVAAFFRDTN
jgi:hypothetical protein